MMQTMMISIIFIISLINSANVFAMCAKKVDTLETVIGLQLEDAILPNTKDTFHNIDSTEPLYPGELAKAGKICVKKTDLKFSDVNDALILYVVSYDGTVIFAKPVGKDGSISTFRSMKRKLLDEKPSERVYTYGEFLVRDGKVVAVYSRNKTSGNFKRIEKQLSKYGIPTLPSTAWIDLTLPSPFKDPSLSRSDVSFTSVLSLWRLNPALCIRPWLNVQKKEFIEDYNKLIAIYLGILRNFPSTVSPGFIGNSGIYRVEDALYEQGPNPLADDVVNKFLPGKDRRDLEDILGSSSSFLTIFNHEGVARAWASVTYSENSVDRLDKYLRILIYVKEHLDRNKP